MINKQPSQEEIEHERIKGAISILLFKHAESPCIKFECRNGNYLTCKYKACGRECQFFNCLGCKYVSECVRHIIGGETNGKY